MIEKLDPHITHYDGEDADLGRPGTAGSQIVAALLPHHREEASLMGVVSAPSGEVIECLAALPGHNEASDRSGEFHE